MGTVDPGGGHVPQCPAMALGLVPTKYLEVVFQFCLWPILWFQIVKAVTMVVLQRSGGQAEDADEKPTEGRLRVLVHKLLKLTESC